MSATTDPFSSLSDAIADRVAANASLVAAVRVREGRQLSGIAWRSDLVVSSDQALPERDGYEVALSGGGVRPATLAGRDPGTNIAVLRLGGTAAETAPVAGAARTGALALALGAGADGGVTVRLAAVREAGPAWHSAAGGRIDAMLRLDMRASRGEEGGPVIDAAGGLIGMATAGPRGRALVIPHATIARSVQSILAHGTMRGGWLGVGLQPVSIPQGLRAACGQESGLMAVSIAAGGPAEQAGILPGDILLALDGEAMIRLRGIRGKLGAERVGQAVEIKLMRGGVVQALRLTVGARPAR
jgi:S1-C subfamily serine protease